MFAVDYLPMKPSDYYFHRNVAHEADAQTGCTLSGPQL
jgi:hypothetical protein